MRSDPNARPDSEAKEAIDPRGFEENLALAQLFEETADLLQAQHANPFRIKAYRAAAVQMRSLEEGVRQIWQEHGRDSLEEIPHIGASLAKAIETWLQTGALGMLLRLRGEEATEQLLMSVPGVGRKLAHRIHHDLHVSSLEALEQAAHNGSLEKLPGMGQRRVQAIRDQLDARLRRRRKVRVDEMAPTHDHEGEGRARRPRVGELLDVDTEYRTLVAAQRLPKIAPRRFNPTGDAWLPILHTHRDERHYTALFSNTALAHELRRTHDWVVIYLDDGVEERQWTVVTERRGPMAGKRIVRGREGECAAHYRSS